MIAKQPGEERQSTAHLSGESYVHTFRCFSVVKDPAIAFDEPLGTFRYPILRHTPGGGWGRQGSWDQGSWDQGHLRS